MRLSVLALGAAPVGNLYKAVPDDVARSTVDAAWECGIRYFDTAPHYGLGLSERRLGAALADRPRDAYVVSTKVGRLLVPDPAGAARLDDQGFDVPADARRVWDFSADGVRRSLDDSLTRLGLDRVDVVYVHDPDEHEEQALAEALPALVRLRDEGVVRAVGVGMNQTAMLERFVERADVDIVMVAGRWTLLDRSAAERLLPLAEERGVGVVAAAPFNSGLLADPRPGSTFDYGAAPAELVHRAQGMASLVSARGCSLLGAALQFPLTSPAVLSVAAGMGTPQQVREDAAALADLLPADLWQQLDRMA